MKERERILKAGERHCAREHDGVDDAEDGDLAAVHEAVHCELLSTYQILTQCLSFSLVVYSSFNVMVLL